MRDLPLIVSRALWEQPFFQATLARSNLDQRSWIVQDEQYIGVKSLIVATPLAHQRALFDYACDLLHAPPADPSADRRIFLTRDPQRGRYLANAAAIEQVVASYGFDLIDADQMRLDDQIVLFGSARYVIGIHGAGLTNLIFRRNAPLDLIELFPPNNLPPHYWWLCRNYGFGYTALRGTPSDRPNAFQIDPDHLRRQIEQMLSIESDLVAPVLR